MLWLFGLMLASKKGSGDEMLIMPSLNGPNITIDTVKVQRREDKKSEEFDFFKEKKVWRLQQAPLKYSVLVDGFKVDQIVNQIRDARRSDETDVKNDPDYYELRSPHITVTLKGRQEKRKSVDDKAFDEKGDEKAAEKPAEEGARQWQFFIGKTSADKNYVYVSTSERPGRVYAVRRSSLDSIFFKDPSALRPKALLDANETIARYVNLKGSDGELELQKNEDATWRFIKPHYGLADFEGKAPSKLAAVPPKAEGVKGLLSAIGNIRVASEADFEPLSDAGMAAYGLEDGKETLRIQVGNPGDGKDDLKKTTLLVGFKVKGAEQYYVRLADDPGVAKIEAKALDPVFEAVRHPGELRSRDLVPVETKTADAVDIRQGKGLETVVKLRGPESKNWQLYLGKESHKADDKTVAALLDSLRGKGEIKEFLYEPEPKKKDAERGLDKPVAEVLIYKDAIAKEEKTKDEEKKDKKEDKAAKEEKKKDGADAAPPLKKDAKPLVTLSFGKTEGDTVYVRRLTQDGTDSRFTVAKTILEKIMPAQGIIAFFDTALPVFEVANVTQLELERKGEKIVILKGEGDQAGRWLLKDRKDYAGKNFADTAQVTAILQSLGHLNVQKWVKKLDPKEDLDKHGLVKPEMTITAYVRSDKPTAKGVADLVVSGPALPLLRPFVAASLVFAEQSASGEPITFKFAKAADKEAAAIAGTRSGVDYLFEVASGVLKTAREADLRDRTWLSQLHPVLGAAICGMLASPESPGNLLAPMPLTTGQVMRFDADNVKEIKAAVRTSFELRHFTFQYNAKDKIWEDRSGLQDFNLDADKVKQLVSWLADLHADRFIFLTGGPREEQKLDVKDAALKIDIIRDDGKTLSLTVGAPFENRGYFAIASTWPEVVFTLPRERIDPMLEGVGYFGKARVVAR
jgi:hypothetical protein